MDTIQEIVLTLSRYEPEDVRLLWKSIQRRALHHLRFRRERQRPAGLACMPFGVPTDKPDRPC